MIKLLLFAILVVILALLVVFVVAAVGAMGATGIVIFGDVIVCIAFIVLILRYLIKRKMNRNE